MSVNWKNIEASDPLCLEPAPLTKKRRKNSSPGDLVTAIIRVTALGKKCRKNSHCVKKKRVIHINIMDWRIAK